MVTRATMAVPVYWRSRDGVQAHAYPLGGPVVLRRPYCGAEPWDRRYDRPAPARCGGCRAVVARLEGGL